MISTFTGESISCLPELLHTVFAVTRVLLAVSYRARMLCQMRMHVQVLVFDFERQRLTNIISSASCHCAHGHLLKTQQTRLLKTEITRIYHMPICNSHRRPTTMSRSTRLHTFISTHMACAHSHRKHKNQAQRQ